VFFKVSLLEEASKWQSVERPWLDYVLSDCILNL